MSLGNGHKLLSINDKRVDHIRKKDKRFDLVCRKIGDIEYSLYSDDYIFFISTFIGQMLSNKASATIYKRIESLCNDNVCPDNINMLFDEEIRNAGVSAQKLGYIRSFTDGILDGSVDLKKINNLSDDDAIKELKRIRGIGDWSAKMYLIFVLDRQDILPVEDIAFLQGYEWMSGTRDRAELIADSEKWKPYSSIVARYLYKALDGGFTKTGISLSSPQ